MEEEMIVLGLGVISLATISFSLIFAKILSRRK